MSTKLLTLGNDAPTAAPAASGRLAVPAYRADIDGLRAVAVLAVVVFHAFPQALPGGFAGVDVFFVISGFLISTIVFSNLERGTFSLGAFYARRIRRIFPALASVTGATLALGWFTLLDDEYAQLGRHAVAGAAFVSNVALWREAGYFAAASETKPMLHLWSLAIEEQFYIVWPVVLMAAWRWRHRLLGATIVVAVLSFGANVYLAAAHPSAAFFLPLGRFWELMLGGILAFVAMHRPALIARGRDAQSVVGFALVAAGLLAIDGTRGFPGYLALLPTLGTALIVSAGPLAALNRGLLASPRVVAVGLVSYPLYLWHWPLLALARIVSAGEPGLAIRGAAIAVSFPLAWLTCRWIERPIRRGTGRHAVVVPALALLAVGVAGFAVWMRDGLPGTGWRATDRAEFARHFENVLPQWSYFERERILEQYGRDCDLYDLQRFRTGWPTRTPVAIAKDCFTRDPRFAKAIFVWGDSHAQQLRPGLLHELPRDWQVLQVASSACRPRLDARPSSTDYCEQSNWLARTAIETVKPNVVLIARESGHDAAQMAEMARRLEDAGVPRVLFIGPVPHWSADLPRIVARRLWPDVPARTRVGIDMSSLRQDAALRERFRPTAGSALVSVIDALCNGDGCLVRLGDDARAGITSFDYGHLTPAASIDFARRALVPRVVGTP